MFGHLDLALADDHFFRTCRCGLCHSLAADYGTKARFLTNDDLSICLWIVLCFTPSAASVRKRLCPLLVWRNALEPEAPITRFAAGAAVLLAGEKLLDDELDEGLKLSARTKTWFEGLSAKAQNVLQGLGCDPTPISTAFIRQRDLEQAWEEIDLASYAAPTGEVLGHLYHHATVLAGLPEHASALGAIGRALGKIIYLLDIVVDYRSDIQCNAFNPLIHAYASPVRRPLSSPSERAMQNINALLAEIRSDIDSALQILPENVVVREVLGSRLGQCIERSLASAVTLHSEKTPAFSRSWFSRFGWQAGASFLMNPRMVLAAEGKNSIDQCAGNTVVLILMFFIYCAVCRGCRNSCVCGHHRQQDSRITINDGCGGTRTYKRNSCSGRYENDDRGCC